jgi:hypothetical protein
MAFYATDLSKPAASRLRGKLNSLEQAIAENARELATLSAMLTGPSDQDASYNGIVSQYGFADAPSARAAYLILQAGIGRIITDAQIDTTASSLSTMFNSLRE